MAAPILTAVPDLLVEIGAPGLKRAGGYLQDEFHTKLQGSKGAKIYREMADNDPVIGGSLFLIESLVRQVKWTVTPASEDDAAVEVRDFVESCLSDMEHTWEHFLSEVLSCLVYGWSYFETVLKIRRGPDQERQYRSKHSDGKFGWRKLAIRAQESLEQWEFEESDLLGMWQQPPPDYRRRFIPISKSLLFRPKAPRDSPEGRSLLRSGYRPWYFLKRLQEAEAIRAERDATGFPKMQVPPELMSPSATSAQTTARGNLEEMLDQIRVDERLSVMVPAEVDREGKPTGYKFELIQSGGAPGVIHDTVIRRYESRIAMSMLTEVLLLGSDKVGSYSLSSTKTSTLSMALGALLDNIAATFTESAVWPLMRLNDFDPDVWPKLVHGDIEQRPLDELAEFLQAAVGAGVLTTDAALEREVRAQAGLPPPMEIEIEDKTANRVFQFELEGGIITIDEARAAKGLGPAPHGEGNLTLPEYRAKHPELFPAEADGGGKAPPEVVE